MDRKAILDYLGDDWTLTMSMIRSSLDSDIDLLNHINSYMLEHGGKQLRPLLSLLMAKACGDGRLTADSARYAAATELLHNATLLHDDVADGSKTRRGAPTVASFLGASNSVLVGDYWLVKAVDLVLGADRSVMEILHLFAGTLSLLAEGEMLQLQKAASADTTEDDYLRIIRSKTGTLFETACISAVISVEASAEARQVAGEYARNLGYAFQIKDDILDYTGGDIGKPVGVDIRERKITLPLLGAMSRVDVRRQEEVREMVRGVADHPENAGLLMGFVMENDGIAYAQDRLKDYSRKAVQALSALPDSPAVDYLVELANFTADRDR
ncbi:MAG: polyprenyl synthetase family protein [Bacteroidales bacterium]|nr:polyprenyl synthetase family protein [Bacteroidales bacterium]